MVVSHAKPTRWWALFHLLYNSTADTKIQMLHAWLTTRKRGLREIASGGRLVSCDRPEEVNLQSPRQYFSTKRPFGQGRPTWSTRYRTALSG